MKSILRAQTVSSRKETHKNNFSNNVFITKVSVQHSVPIEDEMIGRCSPEKLGRE